jgi:hypothetical protein
MGRFQQNFVLLFFAAALATVSFVIIVMNANDEPYLNYRRVDVVTQVITSTVVMTLWGSYSLLILALIVRRRISAAWIIMLLWCVVCGVYLSACPIGYLDDLEQFVLHIKP